MTSRNKSCSNRVKARSPKGPRRSFPNMMAPIIRAIPTVPAPNTPKLRCLCNLALSRIYLLARHQSTSKGEKLVVNFKAMADGRSVIRTGVAKQCNAQRVKTIGSLVRRWPNLCHICCHLSILLPLSFAEPAVSSYLKLWTKQLKI